MPSWRRLQSLLSWVPWYRRRARDADLARELRDHLELETDEQRAAGLPPQQAAYAAHRALGNTLKIEEDVPRAWGLQWLETFAQDVRFAVRMLRKSPGFTAVAVLTLALGIGANTAIFSLIDAVMLRSLPVRKPNQLVIMQWRARQISFDGEYSSFGDCGESGISGPSGCSFPLPIFRQFHSQANAFSGVTAFAGPAALDLTGNGPATIVGGEIVSGDFFSVLGVNAFIGRTLEPMDDSPSASPAAVLSYAYWQSAFGGSKSVIARTIQLNGVPFTIVGVAEPSFTNLSPGKSQDLWLTIEMVPRLNIDWGQKIHGMTNWWLAVIARLKPSVSLAQAQAAATLIFRDQVLNDPKTFSKVSEPKVLLTRAQEGLVGERGELSKVLYILFSAVGIILLIACANIAGLLLSRGAARQKEIAVRLALGAGRAKIVRQLLTESILLSSLGGIFGITLAYWGVKALTTLLAGGAGAHFPYIVAPDWRVLTFALGICLLTGIFFGLGPAFRATRVNLTPALKESASTIPGSAVRNPRFHLGSALVIAQVALSVVVLAGAGLLVRTLKNLRDINPGFDTGNVLLFAVDPTLLGYNDPQMENLYADLRQRLAALPGVTSVSNSSEALLDGSQWTEAIHFADDPEKGGFNTDMLAAGPEFFTTMRIPLLEGRMFTPADFEQAAQASAAAATPAQSGKPEGSSGTPNSQPPAAPVSVLVNKAFVQRYYANENPLGKRVWYGGGNSGSSGGAFGGHYNLAKLWQIAGIVGDTKYDKLRKKIQPMVYIPFTSGGSYFEVRTASDPRALIAAVRSAAAKIDGKLPLTHMRTQIQVIDRQLSQERLVAQVSGFFALLALALSCIGLYGLLAYEISRRTREIGIRIALGAQRREVLRLVVGRGILLALFGVAVGIGAALGVTRFLASMLYGVRATDIPTFAVVIALLLIVALAACWIPARRAMKVDPMIALRHE